MSWVSDGLRHNRTMPTASPPTEALTVDTSDTTTRPGQGRIWMVIIRKEKGSYVFYTFTLGPRDTMLINVDLQNRLLRGLRMVHSQLKTWAMEQRSQVLGDQEIPQSGRSYWEARWRAVATEELGVCFDADFFLKGFSQIAQNDLELRIPRNMSRLKKWNLWSTKHYKFVRWNFVRTCV